MPNGLLHELFGEVNIASSPEGLEIIATILREPTKEGAQTGVALDGSASMRRAFGRLWSYSEHYDASVVQRLLDQGKATWNQRDGQEVIQYTEEGWDELRRRGLILQETNVVEAVAQEVIPYLAERIDADGGTTVVYWAAGEKGDQVEELGDFTADQARRARYVGPRTWGEQTCLLPAVRYFVERFPEADWGFYVFVTDGRLDDLEAVKSYTADLARRIASGRAKPVKCVLIGVGDQVDEVQMQQLDDLPDALGLQVDIWDHKIASTMRDLRDIFAEVVDENTLVAPTGRVFDEAGDLVKAWDDGVPARLVFTVPAGARSFTLEVAGQRIHQALSSVENI